VAGVCHSIWYLVDDGCGTSHGHDRHMHNTVLGQKVRPCDNKKKIYIIIATPGRASATSCEQGHEQPADLFYGLVKGRWQEDVCKFNQSSSNCVATIRSSIVCKPQGSNVPLSRPTYSNNCQATSQPEPTPFMCSLH
jgi:hypothetical protein